MKDNGKNEKKFDIWYKKLTEMKKLSIFQGSKEGINHLKKLNHLKTIVEGIMKARKQSGIDDNKLAKMDGEIDVKDNGSDWYILYMFLDLYI